MRHSYATAALKAGVHLKIVSARLGHASETFTASVYQHALPGMDRGAAGTIAALVLGTDNPATLSQTDNAPDEDKTPLTRPLANPLARTTKALPQMISEGALPVVAGTGSEPATSGYRTSRLRTCHRSSNLGDELPRRPEMLVVPCHCRSTGGTSFRGVKRGRFPLQAPRGQMSTAAENFSRVVDNRFCWRRFGRRSASCRGHVTDLQNRSVVGRRLRVEAKYTLA
jgi:hypothetical protein